MRSSISALPHLFLVLALAQVASCGGTSSEEEPQTTDYYYSGPSQDDNGSSPGDGGDDTSSSGDDHVTFEHICDAPGSPSTFLPFSSFRSGTLGGSNEELWFCIRNPFDAIELGLTAKGAGADLRAGYDVDVEVDLYSRQLYPLDPTMASTGLGGADFDDEETYETPASSSVGDLEKGKLYVRFVVRGPKDYPIEYGVIERSYSTDFPWE